MTFIPDLAPYSYDMFREPETLTVGWLDRRRPFAQGQPNPALLDCLWRVCRLMGEWRNDHSFFYRGSHQCGLCPGEWVWRFFHQDEELPLGSGEIRVIGAGGQVYAAPNLIFHYIRDHRYQPPAAFTNALFHGVDPETAAFKAALYRLDIQRYSSMPQGLAEAFKADTVEPLSHGLQQIIDRIEEKLRLLGPV